MKTLSRDTDPDAEAFLIERTRQFSPLEKFQQLGEMMKAGRQLSMMGIRRRYPKADEREIILRYGALTLDRETMIRVFDWDPEIKGY